MLHGLLKASLSLFVKRLFKNKKRSWKKMLTSKQRAFLKSEAHSLKPIIQIGKNGLNDHIKTSIRQALDARELIKVTLLQNTDEDIHEVAEILEEEIGCDTVLKIGRILILYKVSAKKENRKLSPKVKAI
ncbi:RNA binding protein [Streptococcus dysgalactiae subsp. equisimilis RE378]|nr:hypothetical RNA binding protein [Streptococcus dysgalactiae subsp. equisimilis GGS_124]BAM60517.1 RNA binding protein [Streptococcus dysgalactiae subsp. equisimilis RE378]